MVLYEMLWDVLGLCRHHRWMMDRMMYTYTNRHVRRHARATGLAPSSARKAGRHSIHTHGPPRTSSCGSSTASSAASFSLSP